MQAALMPAALMLGALALLLPRPALAADGASVPPLSTFLASTPDAALRSFAPDRPLNAISPVTVDSGRLQVESDILLYSRMSDDAGSTRFIEALDPEVRLGLTPSLEFDVTTAGLLADRTTSKGPAPSRAHDIGTGSVTLQARYNLLGNDGGPMALALAPFVTLPSGDRHFGTQRIDVGLLVPLSLSLPSDFTLVLQSGAQAMHTGTGPAFASFTNIANLSHAVPGIDHLTASVEFTSVVNADRATPDVYTVETAVAYLVTPTTQLDLGAFLGLNRAAPAVQVAAGIAHRF